MANQALYIQQINFAKIFLSEIKTQVWSYTNPTGSPITFSAGTVFGAIYATANAVRDCQSGSTDGSQKPYGVLLTDITVAGTATVNVTLVVSGIVVDAKLIFSNGTDTLNTTVSVGGDVDGTMKTLLTQGGIWPTPDTTGDYDDND